MPVLWDTDSRKELQTVWRHIPASSGKEPEIVQAAADLERLNQSGQSDLRQQIQPKPHSFELIAVP